MKYKAPNKHTRFAYARIPCEDGVTYRLSRRDFKGTIHFTSKTFPHGHDRTLLAIKLRAMRWELKERVDLIELKLLGVEA